MRLGRIAPRFTLWHSRDTRSLRVLWTFEELRLQRSRDYRLHTLPFPPRQHNPEFLKTNVLGTVPWFEHQEADDASPRAAMSESCAAPLYLVSLFDSLGVKPGESDYGAYLNWLFHADATLTFPQAVVMRYGLFERGRADAAAVDYGKWYIARLRLLNATLADGRAFVCGDRFTIADICITFALFNASEHGICGGALKAAGGEPLCAYYKPQTLAYLQRMMERPAWCACAVYMCVIYASCVLLGVPTTIPALHPSTGRCSFTLQVRSAGGADTLG